MKRALAVVAGIVVACGKPPPERTAPPLASASTVTALPSGGPPVAAPPPHGSPREITWHFEHAPFGASDVVVIVPFDAVPSARFPVLVAFHGRGESLKGPALGARGWVDDYTLGTTTHRLANPPLTSEDLLGFVTASRLAALNGRLAASPYRGVIVVCPYLPDVLKGSRAFDEALPLSRFLADVVLPRVRRELPALGTTLATGVDGVSLGGRASLLVGLSRPDVFGAVGALQPALDGEEATRFADLAAAARRNSPTLRLHLLTSDGDYFLEPTRALSRALRDRNVEHQLDVVTGPHSYDFNRGPGGYEMLLFHDEALR